MSRENYINRLQTSWELIATLFLATTNPALFCLSNIQMNLNGEILMMAFL